MIFKDFKFVPLMLVTLRFRVQGLGFKVWVPNTLVKGHIRDTNLRVQTQGYKGLPDICTKA